MSSTASELPLRMFIVKDEYFKAFFAESYSLNPIRLGLSVEDLGPQKQQSWALQAFKKRFFWALTALGAPGDGGLSLHKFRSVAAFYRFELDAPGEGSPKSYHPWTLQALKKRFFWALTVLGTPGDGGLSLHKFQSVAAFCQFELDAPRGGLS